MFRHSEGLEIERFDKIKSSWDAAIDHCFAINVLLFKMTKLFSNMNYTGEQLKNPFRRSSGLTLNKMILELFLESFEEKGEIERILHYAKNANEYKLVVQYAPVAAGRLHPLAHILKHQNYFSPLLNITREMIQINWLNFMKHMPMNVISATR